MIYNVIKKMRLHYFKLCIGSENRCFFTYAKIGYVINKK